LVCREDFRCAIAPFPGRLLPFHYPLGRHHTAGTIIAVTTVPPLLPPGLKGLFTITRLATAIAPGLLPGFGSQTERSIAITSRYLMLLLLLM